MIGFFCFLLGMEQIFMTSQEYVAMIQVGILRIILELGYH